MRRLLFALVLSACAAEVPDVGSSDEPIVGGVFERGHPEVIFMYRQDGAACTGSIIAPRVVLTAYHCVEGAPASYFRIFVGSAINQLTAEYRVSEVRPVPGAGFDRNANDVALLILAGGATETPIGIARQSPSSLWGATVTSIGFGQTPSGGSGTKYTTTTTVDAVQEGYIFVQPSVCQGDSGGPVIGPDGLVYGVASFIYSPDGLTEPRCGTAPGAYNEIWRHTEFIDSVLTELGTCIPDGVEACDGEDDNCDGVVDEGCLPIGTPCTDGTQCVGGVCTETAIGLVCTSTCDPLRPSIGCGAGFYCSMSGCNGYCLPGEGGNLGNDEDCTADTECISLFCHDPGDGRRRCLDPCRGDAGLCLAGEVCAAGPGACGGCVPRDLVRSARGLGEPCDTDDECRGEMVCHEYGGISECASSCTTADTCGDGFECREMLCVRDRRQGVGGVCIASADCGEAVCATQSGRQWCTSQCTTAADCPANFDCVDGGGARVCAPMGSLVGEECTGNADCVTELCAGLGGMQVCTAYCDARSHCPPGFECRRTGTGTSVCIRVPPPPTDGGCSAGRSGSDVPAIVLAMMALVGLVVRRRSR